MGLPLGRSQRRPDGQDPFGPAGIKDPADAADYLRASPARADGDGDGDAITTTHGDDHELSDGILAPPYGSMLRTRNRPVELDSG